MDFLYRCSQSSFDWVRDRVNVTKFSESARKQQEEVMLLSVQINVTKKESLLMDIFFLYDYLDVKLFFNITSMFCTDQLNPVMDDLKTTCH